MNHKEDNIQRLKTVVNTLNNIDDEFAVLAKRSWIDDEGNEFVAAIDGATGDLYKLIRKLVAQIEKMED
jgi:hypothetical protein